MYLKALTLTAILALAACSEQISEQDLKTADYGPPISQATCEKIARDTVTPQLRDPTSPIFRFAECKKEALSSFPLAKLPKQFGYGMNFKVNAKNGFGGYAGERQYYVLINNGKVIRRTREDDGGYLMMPF